MGIYGLMHIRYHIWCIYGLMHIYGLMSLRYHIFCIDTMSHILTISYVIIEFQSSNLTIFRVTWTHTDPMPYIFTSTAFYGPVQFLRPYSSRCNSNKNSLILYLWRYNICTWLIGVIAIIPINFKFPPTVTRNGQHHRVCPYSFSYW